jgi:hypothetical protein
MRSSNPTPRHHRPSQSNHSDDGPLSLDELHRLTIFKWRYAFASMGFTPWQADELTFLTWLRVSHRVAP